MEKQLPKNWINTELGEVTSKPQYGWTSKAGSDGEIKYLRTTDLSKGKVNWETVPYCIEIPDDVSKYQVEKNDILISRAGSVGLSYRIENSPEKAVFASYLIRFKPLINAKLVEYYLQSSTYWNAISDVSAGIAVQNINAPKLSSLKFPLPPLAEQNRIVAQLDRLFIQLETIKTSMANIPVLLKDFRQQVLTQAVAGKLTKEWRKGKKLESGEDFLKRVIKLRKEKTSRKLPGLEYKMIDHPYKVDESWTFGLLQNFGEFTRGKSKHRPRNDEKLFGGDFPFIQTGEVSRSNGLITNYKNTYSEFGLAQSRLFPKGTLCITIAANIAETGILDFDACFPDSVVGYLPFENFYSSKFAMFYFNTIQKDLEHYAPATAQKNINLGILFDVAFPVPPLEEQQEIVSRVESLFAKADAIVQQYKSLKQKIDTLPQALLHKAFKGELTEQLDSDGDARELLKQIQELKTISGKVTKVGKTVKSYTAKEEVLEMVTEPKEKLESKVVKLKPSNAEIYKRTLLAAEIVYQLKDTNTLGHLKLQKMLYLCQEIGSMNLPMNFLKQAMGPYDNLLARSLDKQFVVKKWFEYQNGALLKYKPLENCGKHQEDFQKYFEAEVEQINYLINKFKKFASNQIEAVATLYACWKEAIEQNELITDKLIITKFYQWSKEKEKFREENLFKALEWMRRNGIEPKI